MELRLNKEGVQYVLGWSVKDSPALFPQMILFAGEVQWLPSEVSITGLSSLADAQQAKEELRDRLAGSTSIYQVTINRPATKPGREKLGIAGLP